MKKRKLNRDWLFWKDGGQEQAIRLDLPHDAMLTEERIPDMENGYATGYYPGGKYIYEKKLPDGLAEAGKTVILEFEGIYMNSSVFLNGEKVGGWIYGYTNFYVDLSGKLNNEGDNIIRVIADNSLQPNSRWYTGSGIYRDVNLYIGNEEFIQPDGLKVKTLSIDPAEIFIHVDAVTADKTEVICEIWDNNQAIASGTGADQTIQIPNARLWSADEPNLYTLKAKLIRGEQTVDEAECRFGIRTLTWDAETGLQVNGETVKLKGGCVHHDHGPLGGCSYEKAEYRRAKKLKELGYNAIRYSHNPTTRAFLNACDEIGMYVFAESFDQWKMPQTTYDYSIYFDQEWEKDVTAMVRMCYSHPSVILYGIGNEITDTGIPDGVRISRELNRLFHRLDDSRPTSIAINSTLSVLAAKQYEMSKNADGADSGETVGSKEVNDLVTMLPEIKKSITPESLEELLHEVLEDVDIVGYNYGDIFYEGTHEIVPDRVILGSETFPKHIGSNWEKVERLPYVIGDFMWTAWDYLGETGVGLTTYGTDKAPFSKPYPCLTAGCGSVDLIGNPETQGYYSAVLWGAYQTPYIAVRPVNHTDEPYTTGLWRLTDAIESWSWHGMEGHPAEIEVYSIGSAVELIQDGRVVGRKDLNQCKATFQTTYIPGKLEAVSYDENGQEIARSELISADSTRRIFLQPEDNKICADGEDLLFVQIILADQKGTRKILEDTKVTIHVSGAGILKALSSANPVPTENFSESTCTSYNGRLLAVIQSNGIPGEISITASADGWGEETLRLKAE